MTGRRYTARIVQAYSYGCVMAVMPDEIAADVKAIAADIPDEYIYEDADGESGREGRPHVTIKYGIHTDSADEVRDALAGCGPFTATFGRMCQFHNDNIVLKVSADGIGLKQMHRALSSKLECTDTHAGYYRPHMTVAYLKPDETDPYYYRQFFSDQLEGREVFLDKVLFASADGKETWIPLEGAKVARMARNVVASFSSTQQETRRWHSTNPTRPPRTVRPMTDNRHPTMV